MPRPAPAKPSGRRALLSKGGGELDPPRGLKTPAGSVASYGALALISAAGFFAVTVFFKKGSTIKLDCKISEAIVAKRSTPLTVVNAGVTVAGSVLGIVTVLGWLLLKDKGRDHDLVRYLVVQTIALGAVNELAKLPFKRQRPPYELYHEMSTGYPSSHASAGVAFFGLLALMAASGERHRWAAIPLALFVPAVGFSRIYLGVHWFSDIVAGYLLGASYLGGSLAVLSKLEAESGG